jgi:hypothetical protein
MISQLGSVGIILNLFQDIAMPIIASCQNPGEFFKTLDSPPVTNFNK